MERPNKGMLTKIMGLTAAMGAMASGGIPEGILSPAQQFHRKRGKAGPGKRWLSTSAYWPAGDSCNVKPAMIKNPKIRAHVQMMHEKWRAAFDERRARQNTPA